MMIWSYQSAQARQCEGDVSSVKPTKTKLFQLFKQYAEVLNVPVHPAFRDQFPVDAGVQIGEGQEEKGLAIERQSHETPQPSHLNLYKHRIDTNSFKILFAVLPLAKIHTLKFANNGITQSQMRILVNGILEDNCPINYLFIDWNPIYKDDVENFVPDQQLTSNQEDGSLFAELLKSKNLKGLYLRSNHLNILDIEAISKNLSDNKALKILDLSDNKMRNRDLKTLSKALDTNRTIQYLGLSHNKIKSIHPLLERIGKLSFPQGQVDAHQKRIKQRDQIIEKNKKKKKGQPEDPVPIIDQIQEDSQNPGDYQIEWFIFKNVQFCQINLSLNKIDDSQIGSLQQFMQNSHQSLIVSLQGNRLSSESYFKLKDEFSARIS